MYGQSSCCGCCCSQERRLSSNRWWVHTDPYPTGAASGGYRRPLREDDHGALDADAGQLHQEGGLVGPGGEGAEAQDFGVEGRDEGFQGIQEGEVLLDAELLGGRDVERVPPATFRLLEGSGGGAEAVLE